MRLRSSALLREYMAEQGFSLGRLARYVGCSKGFISHLLAGRRNSCKPGTAERIAEALHAPIEALFVPCASTATGHSTRTTGRTAAA